MQNLIQRVLVGALFWATDVMAAVAPAPATPPNLLLNLVAGPLGWESIQAGPSRALVSDLLPRPGSLSEWEGLTLERDPSDPAYLRIGSSTLPLLLQSPLIPGWSLQIPPGNTALFRSQASSTLIDLVVAPTNTSPMQMTFFDGAKAVAAPGARLRIERFEDESFYCAGRAGNVPVALTPADGDPWESFPARFFVEGGPLSRETNGEGRTMRRRLLPSVPVFILGPARPPLTIRIMDGDAYHEEVIEDGVPVQIETRHGGRLELALGQSGAGLRWKIHRGVFRFQVAEIPCWEAVGITGQGGTMTWDGADKAVDLENAWPTDKYLATMDVAVWLNQDQVAAVSPASVFQYMQLDDCYTFLANGQGNEVGIYNARTGEKVALNNQGLAFRSSPAGSGSPGGAPPFLLNLSITPDGETVVATPGGFVRLEPGQSQTVSWTDGVVLRFNVSPQGSVAVSSVSGDFRFQPAVLNEWFFDVRQGDTLEFSFSPGGRIFNVHTDPNNSFPVDAGSPSGLVPQLGPDASLRFLLAEREPVLAGTQGPVVIFQESGSSPTGFGEGVLLPPPREIDISRTPQPPASVVR